MVQLAFRGDDAAVSQDNVLGDRQAEASASAIARAGFVHPVEALEKPRQMFTGDARTEVPHVELHEAFHVVRADQNRSPCDAYLYALSIRLEKTWKTASRSAETIFSASFTTSNVMPESEL